MPQSIIRNIKIEKMFVQIFTNITDLIEAKIHQLCEIFFFVLWMSRKIQFFEPLLPSILMSPALCDTGIKQSNAF